MSIIGSVTRIKAGCLRPGVLLCFGEEPAELLAALGVSPNLPPACDYRGTKVWNINQAMVVRAGLGSGEVTTVTHELLALPELEEAARLCLRPRRLILVGTAGRLKPLSSRVQLGEAYAIAAAEGSTTALRGLPGFTAHQRLKPRWPGLKAAATRTIVSTDYFYDFAPTGRLKSAWKKARERFDLVDMEVAAFYHRCRELSRDLDLPRLCYLAIKGAANDASAEGFSEQNIRSQGVLQRACRMAMELLAMDAT